jgi:hypothetical protein
LDFLSATVYFMTKTMLAQRSRFRSSTPVSFGSHARLLPARPACELVVHARLDLQRRLGLAPLVEALAAPADRDAAIQGQYLGGVGHVGVARDLQRVLES